MIHQVTKLADDAKRIREGLDSESDPFDYNEVIVKKPWGYEYLVYGNDTVAIWMLQIIRKRATSMHCHPGKRTGLILLSNHGTFHALNRDLRIDKLDAINIDPGAFHSTEANSELPIYPVSEDGIWVLEIESPPNKKDLCRLSDSYGRAQSGYEGTRHMVFDPKDRLRLDIPVEPLGVTRKQHLDLIFQICSASVLLEQNKLKRNALVAIIRLNPTIDNGHSTWRPGEVFEYHDFQEKAKSLDLSGTLVLTIEKEEKLVKLSDYIASYMAELGVRHVFSVSGGGAMHLVDSFGSHNQIRYVATHHEQAAAMAAEGYARISGGPGVGIFTSGPGGTNAITGVCGAWIDSIPAVYFSGQVTQNTLIEGTGLRQFGVQESDIIELVKSVTKYAVCVKDPATIRYHLEKACYLAMSGRPGPVWLDIPLDVQSKIINPDDQKAYVPDLPEFKTPLTSQTSRCLEMLREAKRPVLIYGYGIRLARAENQLRKLISTLGIPTISSWTASDIVPSDDPDYVGRSGIMGDRAGNFAVQNADLIIALGTRLSIPQIGYNHSLFAREAKKIMVDIDKAELEKPSLKLDIAIQSDVRIFLDALLDQMGENAAPLAIEDWKTRCQSWKKKYPVALPEYKDNTHRVNSFFFVDQLSKRLGSDAVVVTDMGTSFTCTMQTFQTKMGQRLFTSSGHASMGFGLPGAMGACLAAGRKTILIAGDGGLQMNIQELQTVAHNKIPLIMFVLNNEGYLTIKLMQQNHFGRLIGSERSSGVTCPDLMKLADANGLPALRINNQKELCDKLDGILEHPGPLLCEILMPSDQPLIPRVSSLKLPDGTIISKPIEDLFPFLDRDEFAANMIVKPIEILTKKS